ncbi:hypothetical protein DQM18_02755, partial [Enterococcus faecium]
MLKNCENVGASILVVNDRALYYTLKKFRNFDEVANYFFMSKATLEKESSSWNGNSFFDKFYKVQNF